jgi:hypothetical protein
MEIFNAKDPRMKNWSFSFEVTTEALAEQERILTEDELELAKELATDWGWVI